VHVIGHEHIGVHGAPQSLLQFGQHIQIKPAVFIDEESARTAVAALDDAPGDTEEAETGSAGHGECLERQG
jgi:hypothetical protein